jgi:hypothetical protein
LVTSLQYAFIDYSPYALGLDACLYRKKLKWNEAYSQKLVVAFNAAATVDSFDKVMSLDASQQTEAQDADLLEWFAQEFGRVIT